MQHPFPALEHDYASWVANCQVRPECERLVERAAERLVSFLPHYSRVSALARVPMLFMATSFERESGSDFSRSPAQGDRWDHASVNEPRGVGPFDSWDAAAIWSYRHDGLDLVGLENWTWPRFCYEGEVFNGFGYRDHHGMRSPYVVGGTNLQQKGKYTGDGKFDAGHMDEQLGILPVAMAMVRLSPIFAGQMPALAAAAPDQRPALLPRPPASPLADHDVEWVQRTLNEVLPGRDLVVDGSYGRMTRNAVREFQAAHPPLAADGLAGSHTVAVLKALAGQA